jgi:hypothetical protein
MIISYLTYLTASVKKKCKGSKICKEKIKGHNTIFDIREYPARLPDHAGSGCKRKVVSKRLIYRFKVISGIAMLLEISEKLRREAALAAISDNPLGKMVRPSIWARSRTSLWRIVVIYEPNYAFLREGVALPITSWDPPSNILFMV